MGISLYSTPPQWSLAVAWVLGFTHNSDLPIVLAGAGYQTGDYRVTPGNGLNKVPLCNLFVDIAQKAGVSTNQFGISTGVYSWRTPGDFLRALPVNREWLDWDGLFPSFSNQ